MQSAPGEGNRVNLFALVTYIPDPLGSFIVRLRQELVPSCRLRTHVTILPPRPLFEKPELAWQEIQEGAREFSPFELRLGDIEMFSISSVVYLAVAEGIPELCRIHDRLNSNSLAFREPYPYHPHITVAQQLAPEQVAGVYELARRRWAEFREKRSFPLDRVTFVQGESLNSWIDLAECPIGTP